MNTLKIILYDGELNYKTNQKTVNKAFDEWADKIKSLGLYDIPIVKDFIQAYNAHLFDENGSFIDSLHDLWKETEEYKDFIKIKPTPFNIRFKDEDYDIIQLHSIEPLNDLSDVIGFVGSISWINNKLEPLDGDSYYPEMLVYSYKKTDGILNILVKDW